MARIAVSFDKGATAEQKAAAYQLIETQFAKSRLPVPGQLPLSYLQLALVELINLHLQLTMEELNLPLLQRVRPEQVHILLEPEYGSDIANEHPAFFSADAVYCNAEKIKNVRILVNILAHEIFHLVSFRSYYVPAKGEMMLTRIGYMVRVSRVPFRYFPFKGLNEAVTEQSVLEMLQHCYDDFLELGLSHKDLQGTTGYVRSREILSILIRAIAKHRRETQLQTWQRFQRGMFTGQLLHLRDIAKFFGRKGYQVSAIWGNQRSGLGSEEANALVRDYFQTQDKKRKEEVETLLGV